MGLDKQDKELIEVSTITVIDNIVATIDNTINNGNPLLSTAWGLSKGLYGAHIQLRQKRAIEFIEMIRDNPNIFTRQILQTAEFHDGFVYTFQKYLNERIEEKRNIIKAVFLGFTSEPNKNNFKLERILYTIEQLSVEDIEVFKIFYDKTTNEWIRSQFPDMEEKKVEEMANQPHNITQIGDLILNEIKGLSQFKDNDYTIESLMRLANLGLLIGGVETQWNGSDSTFRKSSFGKEFVSYILT